MAIPSVSRLKSEAGYSYVDSNELQEATGGLQTQINNKSKVLIFSNVVVAASAWVSNATYSEYPYKADMTLSGVTAAMVPDVAFGLAEAVSGNFAPVAETGAGYVRIWAKTAPSAAITVASVQCV